MKLNKTTLKNGLRILSIPMPHVQTITVMVLVGTGSEYESKRENGLAHFLEHMCFKGTVKRPTAHDITYELDSIGADYNAFTGGTYTGYYAKSHKKNAFKILDIISDIYLNSTFPQQELKKEQSVIVQEINMKQDNPRSIASDLIDELIFGDTPPGRTIIGTKKTVQSFTRNDLLNYHKKFYVPGATLVIVSGAVPKDMTSEISTIFSRMKKAPVVKKEKVVPEQTVPALKIRYKDTNQTQLILAFTTKMDMFDKKVPESKTLSTVLGGGMSSRLFTKIREEMGLCYGISTAMHVGSDGGMFVVRAAVGHDKVEEVKAILEELRKVRDEGISEKELRKVKDYRLSGLVLGLETSEDYAEYYGFQELSKKKVNTPEEAAVLIEKVTAAQVQSIAKNIFKNEVLNLAIVGPHKSPKSLKSILKI
jgi:predicted Zn-dependent peptidase